MGKWGGMTVEIPHVVLPRIVAPVRNGAPGGLGIPSLVDLGSVEQERRAAAWHSGARTYFPGLSVSDMSVDPVGAIGGSRFGEGRLWTILSPPLQVSYDPEAVAPERTRIFSVMLQLRGSTTARQSNRVAQLGPGEMCVIDSQRPFELRVTENLSQVIVMMMPRHAALSRHPFLENHTAEMFDPNESGSVLLRSLLLNILECAPTMGPHQRSSALQAIIQLLGAPGERADELVESTGWRVRAALSYIDAHLADPDLDACRIAAAQSVSRRRLDEIMVAATGASVSSHIWSRRLEQAANDLLDERYAAGTITQVAFAAGFEDVSHFTRAFKRRYRVPPSEWRNVHRPNEAPAAASPARRRRN
ncbi:MAG TPA: helix-turn-helix domain-containing protein [Steroidobacteraceae bacterium]